MTPDIALAISVELSHIVNPNWHVQEFVDHFVVTIPSPTLNRDVLDEVWRVARFVAYSNFVSIEQPDPLKIVVTSRLPSGNGFTIVFSARA